MSRAHNRLLAKFLLEEERKAGLNVMQRIIQQWKSVNEPKFDNMKIDTLSPQMSHVFDNWLRVSTMREKKGLSQKELSRKSGLSVSYISKIENGRCLWLLPETFEKLAFGLGIRATDLVKEIASPKRKWYSYLTIKELKERQS